jgi:hypothetical protein
LAFFAAAFLLLGCCFSSEIYFPAGIVNSSSIFFYGDRCYLAGDFCLIGEIFFSYNMGSSYAADSTTFSSSYSSIG